jgi:hypothetical protein
MKNFLNLLLVLCLSAGISAQGIEGGAGILTVDADPNGIALLDAQDARGESVFAFNTTNNTYYGYDGSLASGSRWYALATTDDQTGSEVTLTIQNGIVGANSQAEFESLRAAIAAITTTTVSAGASISVVLTGTDYAVTNDAPDLTVAIADGGSGNVTVAGTYPNFTLDVPDNLDNSVTNEAQALTIADAPDPTITLAAAGGAGGGTVQVVGGTNITAVSSGGVVTLAVPSLDDADASITNEQESTTITAVSDPVMSLTTTGGTLGARGQVQYTAGAGIGTLGANGATPSVTITNLEFTTITATSHTAAGVATVAIGEYFLAANPNEMGVPAGTKIRRAY